MSNIQHNSESGRCDESKGEPAQRIKIRKHRRILQICLYQAF
ncbi:MAG: palindromic element RPE3 domain-containing protein [Rickettsia endosymbiont of Ixodes persulcatus]|nr:palindromic element RPE3 domain-containing protein [Rickettsia endosymbiont of Ixodes persulcatus]MCZ6925369.1 palindromic element RPE3 domain-containing protein [Rickettsia endosymbiont of Ixodes persulcatus]